MSCGSTISTTIRTFLAVLALLFFAASMALAQAGRGSISGVVSDPSGAVVSGAQVTALNHATGVPLHTVTSDAGLFSFISLNPGSYVVTASQKGFESVARDNVSVTVDQATTVNIALQVGSFSETIEVKAATELVDTSNSTVGQLVDSATIDRVPSLYRNVYDLAQLSAGVTPPNGSPNSSDSMQSIQNIAVGRPGVDVSSATINGAIVGSVYYMLDGSPIGIAENNSAAIIPAMDIPEDGVDEVRVETQNTPASYQSGAAGVISLVSKSGGNQFHGDVFGVFRPDILSANEYFNKQTQLSSGQSNTPPSFHRYQEGAAIGGPIKKDKLFFFADYEDTQQQQFQGIKLLYRSHQRRKDRRLFGHGLHHLRSDPTRRGRLAAGVSGKHHHRTRIPSACSICRKCRSVTSPVPRPVTRQPATFRTILDCRGWIRYHAHRFDARVDWAKSERQRIFARFSYDHLIFSTANVFPSGWDPDYAQNVTNGRNILIADDLTLNSSTVLNLRYSFTRHHENQGGPASYLSTDITNLGFPSSLASEVVFKQLPFVLFDDLGGGVGGTADYNNFVYASENSDLNATITKVHGKHEISAGFEYMKRYLNVGQPPAPAGAYGFDISATDQSVASAVDGSDFASLLVGMGSQPGTESNQGNYPSFTKDIFAAESNPYYAAFVEDTYHASKSLTITAGLRWDIFGGRNERFNRQEYFNPNATNTFNGVSYTGAEIYANGGNRSPYTANLHDFGPRLGFAWQPVTHLVLRGGAGIYYGPTTFNVASAVTQQRWLLFPVHPGMPPASMPTAIQFSTPGSGPCTAGAGGQFHGPILPEQPIFQMELFPSSPPPRRVWPITWGRP